jgi:hypothetical protein
MIEPQSHSRQKINYTLLSSTGAIVAVAITGFVTSFIFYGYSYCWSYFMELAQTVRLIL